MEPQYPEQPFANVGSVKTAKLDCIYDSREGGQMKELEDLVCETCGKESKSRVVVHVYLTVEDGPLLCHIYQNGWFGECEGVATCPRCTGKIEINLYGLALWNKTKRKP